MRTLSRLSLASFTFALAAAACGAPANDESNMNTQPIGVGAVADVDATVDLEVCGSVDLYVAASAHVDGMLELSGKHFWIKAGAKVDAEAKLAVHADVCIKAKVDIDGKLVAIVVLDKGATTGTGGSAGGGSGDGSGGGGSSGGNCDDKGTCCGGGGTGGGGSSSGTGGGGSSGGGSSGSGSGGADLDLSANLHICGKLDAFTAAGANAGSCVIAGNPLPIKAGAQLTGQVLATVGADVCLDAKLDVDGNISDGNISRDLGVSGNARVKVCGHVTAYAAASVTAKGKVAIGGCGLDIAAGAKIDAKAALAVDASVCIDASLDANGDIAACVVTSH